jgi:hypothetical protein
MPAYVSGFLGTLEDDLKRNVACVPEAHVDPSRVYVFFPQDMVQEGLGSEVITYVDTEKKEVGYALNAVGQAVGMTLWEFTKNRLKECRTIEVTVRPNHEGDQVITYNL